MQKELQITVEHFCSSVDKLFSQIHSWLKETPLKIQEKETKIREEGTGYYSIPMLFITDSEGNEIATFKPVGALIIAAKGRVDIIGPFSKEILVYLNKGGPTFQDSTVIKGHRVEKHVTPLFQGVTQAGWYWIEEKKSNKAYFLNKELLKKLITEVSDYEFK